MALESATASVAAWHFVVQRKSVVSEFPCLNLFQSFFRELFFVCRRVRDDEKGEQLYE